MDAIVAVYSDWGIGDGGTQPVVLHADRKHFSELTRGAAVIVGRRTLADLPGGKPLKGRNTIVVSRQELDIDGAELAHSVAEAVELSKKYERCLVIGGAGVYREFFPVLDRVYITKIDCAPVSTAFFPNLDVLPDWHVTAEGEWQQEDGIRYKFMTYEKTQSV